MLIQGMKQTTPFTDDERENQEAIARTVVEEMISRCVLYIRTWNNCTKHI